LHFSTFLQAVVLNVTEVHLHEVCRQGMTPVSSLTALSAGKETLVRSVGEKIHLERWTKKE